MNRTILTLLIVGVLCAPATIVFPEDKTSSVRYFQAGKVEKNVPFAEGDNYKVLLMERNATGEAEVHAKYQDIIYVLQGSADFVTGGTVVKPRNTTSTEIRGTAIEGGQTHKLNQGDTIIVPNKTPHWFQKVSTRLLYLTVKVEASDD